MVEVFLMIFVVFIELFRAAAAAAVSSASNELSTIDIIARYRHLLFFQADANDLTAPI